jgi:LmbE family N-acetylglucosaminyl deacetylase
MTNRRNFLANSLGILSVANLSRISSNEKKLKVLCIGGHPDDPESGCGGTLSKFSAQGHSVTVAYLTTGEANVSGKNLEEAAKVRKLEAENACKIMKAKPIFLGQIDGATFVNAEWRKKVRDFIKSENPDIVFAHWPLDTHPDHVAASIMTHDAWNALGKTFKLSYFEVCAGDQTQLFHPNEYVDITDFQEQKRKAVYCHISQGPADIYACGHTASEDFRGRELGVKAAEAFITMPMK